MRTKRSADAKKPAARADKPAAASKPDAALKIAAAPRKVTTWVAGVDGLSMGIAGAAIVAAGLLVAAYRPSHPAEASTETAATTRAASATTAGAPDAHTAAPETMSAGEAASSRDNWQPTPLTITGCLQRDADAFRLTDTAGIGAPKSRSWKSGFLKKNASSVTVIDSDRRAHLQDHLGHRVSVTGTMVNKEMQIGTLKLVSDSCAEKTKI